MNCNRCGKAVFAAETPIQVPGWTGHNACFKCKECGVKLTLKTAQTEAGEVYCPSHKPIHVASVGPGDIVISTQTTVPDHSHAQVEFAFGAGGSAYGAGGVLLETQKNAPKVPTTVNNVNQMEVRHQGVGKFGSA